MTFVNKPKYRECERCGQEFKPKTDTDKYCAVCTLNILALQNMMPGSEDIDLMNTDKITCSFTPQELMMIKEAVRYLHDSGLLDYDWTNNDKRALESVMDYFDMEYQSIIDEDEEDD